MIRDQVETILGHVSDLPAQIDLQPQLARMLPIEPLLLADVLVAVLADVFVPDAFSSLSQHILHVRGCRAARPRASAAAPDRRQGVMHTRTFLRKEIAHVDALAA